NDLLEKLLTRFNQVFETVDGGKEVTAVHPCHAQEPGEGHLANLLDALNQPVDGPFEVRDDRPHKVANRIYDDLENRPAALRLGNVPPNVPGGLIVAGRIGHDYIVRLENVV